MVNFENSKKKKILISIIGTLVSFYSLAIGIILFIDSHSFLCLLFSVIISIGFFVLTLTTCLCYFKYDDEKIIFRSLFKVETVYFKDIEFFGTGKSTVIVAAGIGGGLVTDGSHGRITYYLVKTKDKKYQPDIPVNYDNMHLIKDDLVEKIRKTNPRVIIKF